MNTINICFRWFVVTSGALFSKLDLPAAAVFSERTLGEEEDEDERQLREGLPGYSEDWQLREALAQCEIDFLSEEEPSVATTCSEIPSAAAAAPLCGLRHFSGDGVDGVFMGAAGIPVRYRL